MSLLRRGKKRKPLSETHRNNIRAGLLARADRSHSSETRAKMSETRRNKKATHSQETKTKISEKMKALHVQRRAKNQVFTCPWCGKIGASPGIFVWHFDHCKFQKMVIQ